MRKIEIHIWFDVECFQFGELTSLMFYRGKTGITTPEELVVAEEEIMTEMKTDKEIISFTLYMSSGNITHIHDNCNKPHNG